MDSDGSENELDTSVQTNAETSVATCESAEKEAPPPAPSRAGDADIVALLGDGDRRGALMLCAQRHGPAIGRLCMALLGSQPEADDALQETLLAAHAGFSNYRGDGSLRAWLFSIARRRCARVLERRTTHPSDDGTGGDHGAPASSESADVLLDARRRAEAARALLAQVRPTEREALLLRYETGLSFREVGEACGVDEAAARKRVSRALARLRKLVKE